ncbi:MAG TPA: YbhB/YbcL family Raf kinase inhibitor-like protein [Gemmatimonadaceae bacterium]|nr:YbhB/YbcL family Raf kinase inhibitor-like protein [Gemmatimonadaceae bacterium]
MRTSVSMAAFAGLLVASAVCAQQPPPAATEVGASLLALLNIPAKAGAPKLTVTSPAFQAGADIPFENTQYKGNVFPGLAWTAGPASTKSYVVIMQDGDAMSRGAPILHWTMINIPGSVTKLDAAMSAPPAGAAYGPNIRGPAMAYMGPRTPAGPKHRYHFQIFALDTVIPSDGAGTYDALTGAMKDHVVASGELVALGQVAP